jgi:type II secretory pathway component GspD/PulD (secretin)
MQSMRSSSQVSLTHSMKLVSKKRVVLATTGASAACLFAFCAARVLAQPAISPASGTTAIAPAIKSDTGAIGVPSALTAPLPQVSGVLDIECIDMPVAEVVNIIKQSASGELDILVTADVDTRLKSISLKNRTPEEAIRLVATAAGLTLTKADNRTYILSKNGVSDPSVVSSANENALVAVATKLPGVGALDLNKAPDLAKIQQTEDEDAPSVYRTVALRNVKPSMMAFWLDPTNHEEPAEFQQAKDRLRKTADDFAMPRSVKSRQELEKLNRQPINFSAGIAPQNFQGYGQFSNPYAPYNPYMQASPQVGGGRNNNSGGRQGGRQNNQGGTGGGTGSGLNSAQGLIPLPNGVEALVAVDPQNALLVRGTEEGINEIRTIIAFLDRPIGQVEIEAQFVTISKRITEQIGIRSARYRQGTLPGTPFEDGAVGSITPGSLTIGVTSGNFRAIFDGIQANEGTRVIASPRVTTFNNLTAQIKAINTQYIVTTSSTTTIPDEGPPVITEEIDIIPLFSGTMLTVTPTINQDGTITIAMQPLVIGLTTQISNDLDIPGQQLQQIDTISNIRDGDTLAIGGLRNVQDNRTRSKVPILGDIPIIGRLFRRKERIDTDDELLIFVTARIVRRVNEPVRGT